MTAPKPRPPCTCSGSTGIARPTTRKAVKTTPMIGSSAISAGVAIGACDAAAGPAVPSSFGRRWEQHQRRAPAREHGSAAPLSAPVLPVGHVLHPVDVPAAKPFLDGGVRHARAGRGAVPMLQARRNPDDVALADVLPRGAPELDPAGPGCDDQDLAERMGVHAVRAPGSKVTPAP